ncbi:DNA alkylation repair protein [Pedobacter gandavensis]|uniref:DNA alkylation repair protein n=1 Tax=Pedobacter gandavensis TaxID=2679963 RepID=UPI00292CE879|nr:DNA alkylation repair protein [Pedobacter gandavensis]
MTNIEKLKNRKGALKVQSIPDEVLKALNMGLLESVNLTEWLAVNHMELLRNVLTAYPLILQTCEAQLANREGMSVRVLIVEISKILSLEIKEYPALFNDLARHPSDSVRCWAVYIVGGNDELDLQAKFKAIYPFAADTHFGVRELAWMAMRDNLETHLSESLTILLAWTDSEDENIRRFATEASRPRGVWCKQLKALITAPELALELLEALKADPSVYVQLSLANWLNDAGKSRPDWVIQLCKSWITKGANEHTLKIVKRATRNLSFQLER